MRCRHRIILCWLCAPVCVCLCVCGCVCVLTDFCLLSQVLPIRECSTPSVRLRQLVHCRTWKSSYVFTETDGHVDDHRKEKPTIPSADVYACVCWICDAGCNTFLDSQLQIICWLSDNFSFPCALLSVKHCSNNGVSLFVPPPPPPPPLPEVMAGCGVDNAIRDTRNSKVMTFLRCSTRAYATPTPMPTPTPTP